MCVRTRICEFSPAGTVEQFSKRSSAAEAVKQTCLYGTVENGLSMVFITLGEPQAHGDTAEAVPFVKSLFPIWRKL